MKKLITSDDHDHRLTPKTGIADPLYGTYNKRKDF